MVVLPTFVLLLLASCSTTSTPLSLLVKKEPVPSLSPREVVAIQLQAFQNNDADDLGIEIAFRFASPENQSSTGPLPRFAAMMKAPAYRIMLLHDRVEFAPTVVRGDLAVQRVALYQGGNVVVYDFILRRQNEGPFQKCWMTDGVQFRGFSTTEDPLVV